MAVRTGGPGAAGLSVMVVPLKGYPGVTMRRLKVSGQITGGTTYIELDDVKVPVGNLIGREGDGMRIIMTNFNHERLTIAVGVTRQARVALAAAFQYTMKREAFGKTLMDQPVVRHRLAKAGAELETMWAWVEQILYQLCHLSKEEADQQLGGITALAKAKAAMVLNECAQCAVLLFGGAGYTASGQGELVEGRFLAFVVPGSRLTCDSDSARCPWSSHTRWIRGRPSGFGRATTGQVLSSGGEETRKTGKDVMTYCCNLGETHIMKFWRVNQLGVYCQCIKYYMVDIYSLISHLILLILVSLNFLPPLGITRQVEAGGTRCPDQS
jgi:hypothetical protein